MSKKQEQRIVAEVELKKLAVQCAVSTKGVEASNLLQVANEIYKFLTMEQKEE